MSSQAEEMCRLEEGLSWLEMIEVEGLQKLDVYGCHMEVVATRRSSMFLKKIKSVIKDYNPLRSA
jgi:hypothetical protein